MILLLVLNFLYASMFMLAKIGLQISTPMFMTGTRMMLGGLFSLIIYGILTKSWKIIGQMTQSDWMLIFIIALINVYSCNALEIFGLQYLPVGKTAFIYNSSPFFSALIAYFIFSEHMTLHKWIGLILGFLGFLPILIAPSDTIDTTRSLGFLSLAELAIVGAAISSVIGWTTIRVLLKSRKNFSPFLVNGLSMFLGGLLCFIHALYFETQPFVNSLDIAYFIKLILTTAIFKHVIAYNLGAYLLTKYTTTLMSFFGLTSSLFATTLGILFFNEIISVYFVVSIICVFVGLLVFYQEELRQGYIN